MDNVEGTHTMHLLSNLVVVILFWFQNPGLREEERRKATNPNNKRNILSLMSSLPLL
jgi:hypothetical protein